MNNNKGFSLIELIVSIAILGIVSIASLGFIISGINGYNSVSGNVNLQNKSQIAMNFIREYVIDSNEGVYFSSADDTLYVFSSKEILTETLTTQKVYTAHIFKYDSSDNCLYYGENPATALGSGEFSCSSDAPDLLSKGVSSFSAEVSGGIRLSSVTVTIDFFVRNKTFKGSENIALRNYLLPVTVNLL